MLKILFFSMTFSLFAQAQLYTIKLASYGNLHNLKKEIAKLNYKDRHQVKITKIGRRHNALVKPSKNKRVLEKKLSTYRRVFSDAFISTVKPSKHTRSKSRKKPSTKKKRSTIKKKRIPSKKKKKKIPLKQKMKMKPAIKKVFLNKVTPKQVSQSKTSFYEKLQDKLFFLCSHGEETRGKRVIMTVYFTKMYVYYSSVLGKVDSLQANYTLKNKKLYIYQKDSYNPKIYSKLEETFPKYHLISSWLEKKQINTLRYYHSFVDAQAYMRSLKQSK